MLLRSCPFALIVVLTACGGAGTGPTDGATDADAEVSSSTARIEVGNGADTFRAFQDGATLDLVHGCQGAQHIWTAIRAWGMNPRGTVLDLSLTRDSDGLQVSQTFTVRVSLQPVDGQVYDQVTGLTLVVPEPDQAIGEDLTLHATVTDMEGLSASSDRHIRTDWGPGGCL